MTALAERVLEHSGYMRELHAERTIEAEARVENLREFLSVTRQFEQEQGGRLGEFLEHVALVSDVDAYDADANSVTMMTLHAAKGLEFPVVFLVGMEDGVFPHSRALAEASELEEERRLCYVGMTRAMERLYLTCARSACCTASRWRAPCRCSSTKFRPISSRTCRKPCALVRCGPAGKCWTADGRPGAARLKDGRRAAPSPLARRTCGRRAPARPHRANPRGAARARRWTRGRCRPATGCATKCSAKARW